MNYSTTQAEMGALAPLSSEAVESLSIRRLTEANQAAVLSFLAPSGIDNIVMLSLICDNGLVSPLNRGTFYGAYDGAKRLVGVALIGHATLVETSVDAAMASFADVASRCSAMHVV